MLRWPTGRNLDEIKRIILALQKADRDNVATPADWRPGQDVIVPTAGSCGTAKERMENPGDDVYCLDWFMCFKREKWLYFKLLSRQPGVLDER